MALSTPPTSQFRESSPSSQDLRFRGFGSGFRQLSRGLSV